LFLIKIVRINSGNALNVVESMRRFIFIVMNAGILNLGMIKTIRGDIKNDYDKKIKIL